VTRRLRFIGASLLLAIALPLACWRALALYERYHHHGLAVVPLACGLEDPWSLNFLPDGRMLVSERPGRLRLVAADGTLGAPLAGLPPVWDYSQSGLLGVALDPRFADNHLIYWSYGEPAPAGEKGGSTAVARGRLDEAAGRVVEVQVIFRQPRKIDDGQHFGSRLLFAPDGRLFVSLGDRFQADEAQQLGSPHGKIMRIEPDGSVPPDNPFVATPGAWPQIWSLGHRNVQGLTWQPGTGELWASEHGPLGGDEINVIEKGANYGWPVITYGCAYVRCTRIGAGTAQEGMKQPITWWTPPLWWRLPRLGPGSTPPTGMTFLTSDRYPQWRGNLFVGTLRPGQAMTRIALDGHRVVEREPMYAGRYERVRDVRQGPDGWLYLLASSPEGCILRLQR